MASDEQSHKPSDLWTTIHQLEARFERETAALRRDLDRQRHEKHGLMKQLAAVDEQNAGQAVSRAGLLKVAGAAAAGLAGTALIGSRGAQSALAAAPTPPSGLITTIAPVRVLDTRNSNSPLPSGGSITLALAGTNGIPQDAIGIVGNLTAVTPTNVGYVAIYPAGGAVPNTSNVNLSPNGPNYAIANSVTVGLGNGGVSITCAVFGGGSVHVLLDIFGFIE